jgi:hypothetical protein
VRRLTLHLRSAESSTAAPEWHAYASVRALTLSQLFELAEVCGAVALAQ